MFTSMRLDDRFLDRPGCGDELYLDSRFRAASWLAGINGLPLELAADRDVDFADGDGDEPAGH
jgi:hypothetical protein